MESVSYLLNFKRITKVYIIFFYRVLVERVANAIKRRRNIKDQFRDTYGYSWDFFMAFRVYDEDDPVSDLQMEHNMRKILEKLSKGGLEIRLFYSLQVSQKERVVIVLD